MPVYDDLPDLTHWRTVQEFSIEQAALLCSGIDPYERNLIEVRTENHPRWKLAWGLSDGMLSAIRRGVLTPVECIAIRHYEEWNSPDEYYQVKPTERGHELSKGKTIITRDSLFAWVRAEKVDIARKPLPKTLSLPSRSQNGWRSHSAEVVIDVNPEEEKQSVLMLSQYNHHSEGLEFVQDAIKELWSTYDEDNPQTAPTKNEVIDYLTERGAGKNMADAVNLVLRPSHLQGIGRRSKKSK
ncbi:hypothetical protein [Winslowiella toletana]|uniref:hypothetical protein n=1 Tax=Winslowiella toletana TaxID=92490 RepID=UPI0028BE8BD9|nr:hypothetical protein [Winslowiella toletana]WNN45445.1 hypothetical protein RIN69_05990 [Winslowiella toletana]